MRYFFVQIIIMLIFAKTVSAEQFLNYGNIDPFPKKFDIMLSGDNKLSSSQDAGTNVALSIINGLASLSDKNDLSNSPLYRVLTTYGAFFTVLWDHEISGHALRAKEFKVKVSGFSLTSPFSAATHFSSNKKSAHLQQLAIISLGGNEASYVLSKKLLNGLIEKNQAIDPVTAAAYMFSSGNQAFYVYAINYKKSRANDLHAYISYMRKMYGRNSMSMSKIKSIGVLDFLDPTLVASIYSLATGNDVKLPTIKLADNIRLLPSARMVLTPYGVIEKHLIAHVLTDYTNITTTFGFGKESKTTSSVIRKYNVSKSYPVGTFFGSTVTPKKHNTYFAELSATKVVSLDQLNLGLTVAHWSQPELLTLDPYNAKIKKGYMLVLNTKYQVKDDLSIFADLGFKTKGFIVGQHLAKTPIIRAGFNWAL
ncbi:MAG: hypothetical protein ACRYE9_00850 [Janthinobacterium lividum]